MYTARDAWFRSLIEAEKATSRETLWQSLTPDLQKILSAYKPAQTHAKQPSYDWLNNIHYSWWLPFLAENSATPLFLSLFSETTCAKIKKHMPLMPKKPPVWTRPFFYKKLLENLTPKNLLPPECLPDDPFNHLLTLSYNHLVHLVDLLCLHDFSAELKTIVSAKSLKKIRSLFTKEQQHYLKTIHSRKDIVAFAPLGLSAWDGNEEKLKQLLHIRGLNRLAKALAGSNDSLIWHITHRFDSGRGSTIQSHVKDMHNKTAHVILKSQVNEIAKLLT